jgi:redox-sensitive bicupin YhaK (pirin superfamily)
MSLFKRKPKGPFIRQDPLNLHWDAEDPFTFVSHHEDDYPHGNRQHAPPLEEIRGRNLGRDYQKRFGFRMYNGKVVPGFPKHAHWGYETVTLPAVGYIDHFDIEGNHGRFGFGDVQWVCASSKYEHCEMYPLVNQEDRNPNDITQIFINMPLECKNKENSLATVWNEDSVHITGDGYDAHLICGELGGRKVESPNGISWTHGHFVRIIRLVMQPGSTFTLDAVPSNVNRNIYYVSGDKATMLGYEVEYSYRIKAKADCEFPIVNGDKESVIWILEGEPIGQKMCSFGPVMLGSENEVREALNDIRINEFTNWPFDVIDKTQPLGSGRFLEYGDGTVSKPPSDD